MRTLYPLSHFNPPLSHFNTCVLLKSCDAGWSFTLLSMSTFSWKRIKFFMLTNIVIWCRVCCHDAFWSHFFLVEMCAGPMLRTSTQLKLCLPEPFPLSSVRSCLIVPFLCCVFWIETSTLSTFCHRHFVHAAICQRGYRSPVTGKSADFKLWELSNYSLWREIWCSLEWKELKSSLQIWYCDHCFIGQVEETLLAIAVFYFGKKKKKWAIKPTFWQSCVCIVQTNCSSMH